MNATKKKSGIRRLFFRLKNDDCIKNNVVIHVGRKSQMNNNTNYIHKQSSDKSEHTIKNNSGWGNQRKRTKKLSEEEIEKLFVDMFVEYHQKEYHQKEYHQKEYHQKDNHSTTLFCDEDSCTSSSSSDVDSVVTTSTCSSSISSLTTPPMKVSKSVSFFMNKIGCCYTNLED